MRTHLSVTLTCSQCGEALECDPNTEVTKVIFEGSPCAEAVLAIYPCKHCIDLAGEPGRLLKKALILADSVRTRCS